ncbi:MAG: glycosyltransferase [Deltaproteobacteria bacterium]|nr:glycosyltransferase [Deltaproteobacteria bacterium]
MRVLLVTNGLGFGGAERIVEALAVDLHAAGDQVQSVATTRGGPIGDRLLARGIPVEILNLRSRLDVTLPLRLRRIADHFRPDVVHSHLAVSDLAVALAFPGRGPRLISTVHNSGVELDPVKRALWHLALRRFAQVLPVGPQVAAALPSGLPITIVEPSLVDPGAPRLDRAEARRRLGLPLDGPVVLAIGRLVEVKGFDVLAAARRQLPSQVTVAVIGEGPLRPALMQAGLTLLGSHPDAESLLPAADVVVSSSRSEGLPQVILAALALGLPVVATAVGGTVALIRSEENGLLVKSENPTALAAALHRVLFDPILAAKLGQAAQTELSHSPRTRAKMVAKVRAIYEGRA